MADIRQEVVDANKKHKSSWLILGKLLVKVSDEKKYVEWGFEKFQDYLKEELGMSMVMAADIMRAFDYVKRHEPHVLNTIEAGQDAYVPGYHVISQLAKAHDADKIDGDQVEKFHKQLFDEEVSDKDISKEIRSVTKAELNPMDDIRKETKAVKRLAKKLNDKLHNTSAFNNEILELSDDLLKKINAVEI